MTATLPASDAISIILRDTHGLIAYLAGSSVAAAASGKQFSYSDVDLFTPNQGSYFALVSHLLNNSYELWDSASERLWDRHQRFGFNNWHTNSLRLRHQLSGTEVNTIYKKVDGHETTRLSQVLESFDFGLLATGYETENGRYHDMRPYFFGQRTDVNGPLPMLPYRQDSISQGFMSQHVMLRTAGRYARYAHTYGYDLSRVKPTMVQGYEQYHAYKARRTKPDDLVLADIALALHEHIANDEFDRLLEFEASLPTLDGVDQILASLE